MMNSEEIQRLKGLAAEIADREGCFVYDVEFLPGSRGQGRLLRVYIDRDGGVSLEDCSNVSRALNLRLDVEDLVAGGPYVLEVSSPGLERVLREKWHFEQAIGRQIWLKATQSLLPSPAVRKQIEATLVAATETDITVDFASLELKIPYSDIEKAHVIFAPTEPVKPGGGRKSQAR